MKRKKMSVSVIGLGRVGLITLLHLAKKGFSPCGIDKDENKIQGFQNKKLPFVEKGFQGLMEAYHKWIGFSHVLPDVKYNFVCVPSPFDSSKKESDLSAVLSVLNQLQNTKYKKKYIFIRSTLPPGGSRCLSHRFKKLSIHYFPEFFREGHFMKDYKNSAYNVIGSSDNNILKGFSKFQFKNVHLCRPEEAEILKAGSNLFHGLKVSFVNEIGRTARQFQVSEDKIMSLFLKDKSLNISEKYLKPGFAFGGSCLKKDIQSLSASQQAEIKTMLSKAVIASNQNHIHWTAHQILKLKPKKISVLGCSFTGSPTIDYRESPVLDLVQLLNQKKKLKIYAVEPILKKYSCHIIPEKDFKQLLQSDVFILGGWFPLLKKHSKDFREFKGLLFDLLVQSAPKSIKQHPNYRTLYS